MGWKQNHKNASLYKGHDFLPISPSAFLFFFFYIPEEISFLRNVFSRIIPLCVHYYCVLENDAFCAKAVLLYHFPCFSLAPNLWSIASQHCTPSPMNKRGEYHRHSCFHSSFVEWLVERHNSLICFHPEKEIISLMWKHVAWRPQHEVQCC